MEFYRQVRTRPLAHALSYVTAFLLLTAVVFGLIEILPNLNSFYRALDSGINEQLPAEAWLEVKAGQFNTNLPPAAEYKFDDVVLVLDATLEGQEFPQAFEDRVGYFIGRDAFFAQSSTREHLAIPLTEISDITITREAAQSWLNSWGIWVMIGSTFVLIILKFLSVFLISLVFAALAALGAKLASRVGHLKMNYSQWLAVGLHAVTLPTIVNFLFTHFGLDMPLVYVVIFFMIIYAVLVDERARPVKKTSKKQIPEEQAGQ